MQKVLDKFAQVSENPYQALKDWKDAESGRKLLGVAPMRFPEEIIHASGMLPVVLQESGELETWGRSRVQPTFCGITRILVDMSLKGELDLFEGIIFPDTCLQMRAIAHIVKRNMPYRFIDFMWFPVNVNPDRKRNLVELTKLLGEFKARIEEHFELTISNESLWESIHVYNRNRELLEKLYDLRRNNPGLLSGREVLSIIQSSMIMPKDEHSGLLEKLLTELANKAQAANNKVKIWLSGQICQPPRVDILDFIERSGGVIVDDDLYYGYRYFAGTTPTDCDPLEALARRYLYMPIICPTRSDADQNWGAQLIERSKESKAQGVIILMVNFCEAHALFYPSVREKLSAAGIPNMMIQTEYETVSMRSIDTRIQAFLEMIRMKG